MTAIESYLTSQHQLSPRTIPGYRTTLINLARSIGPGATIAGMTTASVNTYLASLIAAGKRHMARNTAITVKTFGAWLVETGISQPDQFLYATIRVPRVPKEGRDAFTPGYPIPAVPSETSAGMALELGALALSADPHAAVRTTVTSRNGRAETHPEPAHARLTAMRSP